VTGSAGLLGDATCNLSDVSTSAVVFLGFLLSRWPPTERYPYGLERAEDLAGVGGAMVIWPSAAFAGWQSQIDLKIPGHLPGSGDFCVVPLLAVSTTSSGNGRNRVTLRALVRPLRDDLVRPRT
jgi:divalent metal cation (Fe/Co/Zn/Cd) transporter